MASDSSQLRHDNPSALHAGTRLGEYELLRLLGVGGFGIVYLAFDHALEREVAIKEYMPASLAGRTETMHVSIRSQSDAESFALGLKSFVNEAKLLARFDHPSLLKVHRFWEANGTAYMAMPVMRGRTVKDIRLDMEGTPDEAWTRRILMPLLGAIEKLHSEGVFHRDIAPDNIQIEPDGRPVLLDFGAARRVLSDKSQALTAILKPAYAPIEQYGEAGSVRQGPWTDLYALGATLHYLLLGRPPPPATARTVHDEASSLTTDNLTGCSEAFLHAIDWMLCPRPIDRPQSVAELRDVLEGRARLPARRPADAAPMHWERTSVLPHHAGEGRIDLDVGEGATQHMPSGLAQTPATEHFWIDPQPAAAEAARAGAEKTMVHRRAAVEVDIGVPEALEMTAQRSPLIGAAGAAGAAGVAGAAKRPATMLFVVGAVLAVAIAAGVWFWQQPAAVPAVSTSATPSLTPPVVGPPVAAPAAVATTATSTVTTTPADASASAAALLVPAASAPSSVAAPMPSAVMPPSEAVTTVEAPAKPRVERTPAPQKLPQNPTLKPAQDAPRQRPDPAVPPPGAAPVLAAPSAEAAAAAGPPPSCGSRDSVRYHICMERECGRGEFAGHPACQRWKQEAK